MRLRRTWITVFFLPVTIVLTLLLTTLPGSSADMFGNDEVSRLESSLRRMEDFLVFASAGRSRHRPRDQTIDPESRSGNSGKTGILGRSAGGWNISRALHLMERPFPPRNNPSSTPCCRKLTMTGTMPITPIKSPRATWPSTSTGFDTFAAGTIPLL